jgi:hypothetical protein
MSGQHHTLHRLGAVAHDACAFLKIVSTRDNGVADRVVRP